MARIWHFDGASAIRHEPEIILENDGFRLEFASGAKEQHRWVELSFINDKVYGHKQIKGWRMGFNDPVPANILPHLPKPIKYGSIFDRFGLGPAIVGCLAISAACIGVVIKAPAWLAPLVPMSFEQKLGDAMVGDFGGRICNGPGGQQALDALVKRVEPNPEKLKVRVVNIGMVNAVALPGGNIFIFQGLLQAAKSPEELAGILSHEIGHVRNRDVMQALLRQMGLSIVLGVGNSDATGGVNALISSTYSREAETAADSYAIAAMRKANISPLDTAAFFARLAKMEQSLGKAQAALGYLSSHPLSQTREQAFRASAQPGASYTPIISADQWRLLVNSCKNDPKVAKDNGLFL
jgi:beta-barrel assembly-enhancing protease